MKIWRLGDPIKKQCGGIVVRIGEDARRCVVFFGVDGPNGVEYGGTGFLVRLHDDDLWWPYLVTARHVADSLSQHESFYIRANRRDGEAELLEATADWAFPTDRSVDIAVAPFGLNRTEMDHVHLPIQELMLDFEHPDAIACGDEISIVGLFRPHHGNKRAIPFVHSGSVAVLADPKERVPIKDFRGNVTDAEAILVEAHTLGGLSGSPVFIHEVVNLVGGISLERPGVLPKAMGLVKLLGLYQGAWDGEPGKLLAQDRGFSGFVRVPVGMGLVVPGHKILDLIMNDPSLKEDRHARAEAHRRQNAATMDSAFASNDPQATAENPNHREDFTRLVGAAARKQKPEG